MPAHRLRRQQPTVKQEPRFAVGVDFIEGNTPVLRIADLAQADPAGRYQLSNTGDGFLIQRALTALYATLQTFLSYDVPNRVYDMSATQGRNWRAQVTGGDAAGFQSIMNVGGSTASPSGFELRTGDGVGSNQIRMTISIGAATANITISNANLLVNQIRSLQVLQGDGTTALIVRPNISTDATARRIELDALDPATDTFYQVAQVVPNAASPFFTIFCPDAVPTTSILDAKNIGFRYTSAGAVTLYVNDAGTVKSLALGTPV